MDDLVGRGAFMGCENEAKPGATALAVAPGLGLGCNPGLGLYAETWSCIVDCTLSVLMGD